MDTTPKNAVISTPVSQLTTERTSENSRSSRILGLRFPATAKMAAIPVNCRATPFRSSENAWPANAASGESIAAEAVAPVRPRIVESIGNSASEIPATRNISSSAPATSPKNHRINCKAQTRKHTCPTACAPRASPAIWSIAAARSTGRISPASILSASKNSPNSASSAEEKSCSRSQSLSTEAMERIISFMSISPAHSSNGERSTFSKMVSASISAVCSAC